MVCGEVYSDGWYVVRILCDGRYVVKFYLMGGMWCSFMCGRYVVRVLCDGWYVVRL